MLKLKLQYFGHLMQRSVSVEKTLMLGKIEGSRRRAWQRTRWTWVWVNSGSWWWTRQPGMLQSIGSQRVGHNWVTELNWNVCVRKHWGSRTHAIEKSCWRMSDSWPKNFNRNYIPSTKENCQSLGTKNVEWYQKVKIRPQGRSKIDMLSVFELDHTMMPVHIRKCVCIYIYIYSLSPLLFT